MPRSRQEIISEMVDSGLFTDDEIRQAVAGATQQKSGLKELAQQASSVLSGIAPRPIGGSSDMVARLAKDTLEGFAPPTSMESAKRLLNPNAGQFGPNRFAQDIQDAAAQNANIQAENFVQQPGVNQFPRTAAAIGTGGVLGALMLPSPKGVQQAAGIGKAVKMGIAGEMALRRGLGNLGKAAISTMSPASLDAVKARFENPSAVKNAMTREQLGQSVVSSAKDLSTQIGELDEAAKGLLGTEKNVPKEFIIEQLNALKQKYIGSSGEAVSAEAKNAISEINNVISGINNINPLPDKPPILGPYGETNVPAERNLVLSSVSERQLKDVMSQYKNINWDDPAGGAKKEIRKIIDSVLKENKSYEKAMVPVAQKTKLQALVNKKLSLKYDPQTGTYSTDTTVGKWTPSLLEGKKPETSMALKKLGEATGNDLLNKARMTNYREQFTGGKTQGSRMVQLGRHVAGVPGAILGAAIDKMGGSIAGGLIDVLASVPTVPSMPKNAQKAVLVALSEALRKRRSPK